MYFPFNVTKRFKQSPILVVPRIRKSILLHNSSNYSSPEGTGPRKCRTQGLWVARHLRHDAWEVEHFGGDVGQVAVQEDKQRLNNSDVVCETGGEGSYESQEDADEHPANSHDEEVRDARKHVNGVDGFHLAEWLEQVVQDLGERENTPPLASQEPETCHWRSAGHTQVWASLFEFPVPLQIRQYHGGLFVTPGRGQRQGDSQMPAGHQTGLSFEILPE